MTPADSKRARTAAPTKPLRAIAHKEDSGLGSICALLYLLVSEELVAAKVHTLVLRARALTEPPAEDVQLFEWATQLARELIRSRSSTGT